MAKLRKGRSGIVVAAAICAAAASATMAACSARPTAGRTGDVARATVTADPRDEIVTSVIDLLSSRVGFIGLGDAPTSTSGRAELVRTTNFGQTFSNIGPRAARNTEPDSIFFLDSSHGWFATFSVATLKETVYRTSDGGRTWRAFAAPGHNVAGGSGDSLQFVSPTTGWLVDVVANAPFETLYRTTDGGAHWHVVATLRQQHGGPGTLPELGRITFESNGETGWLGGAMFDRALYRTTDGGRTWHPVLQRLAPGSASGLPTTVGHLLIEPVAIPLRGAVNMELLSSANGGATWTQFSSATLARQACNGPVPTSVVSDKTAWAAVYLRHHVFAWFTPDLGGVWRPRLVRAPVAPAACEPEEIVGQARTFAWLATPPKAGNETLVYATANTGSSWRRIDLAALAAG